MIALYASTIFLSAFLLFQVQPLIAKIILPWFGGSAAVWSAALLFFQTLLLGGYAYAHCSIRWLRPKTGVAVHVALLLLSCAVLPILPPAALKPSGAGDPTLQIVLVLAATVGLPFFLLSATSPLLQAWAARRIAMFQPYRLFALSNGGSLLALLSFPLVVEPQFASHVQARVWSGAYLLFVLLCAAAGWLSRGASPASPHAAAPPPERTSRPPLAELLLWIGLAATPSALLLAVTEHLTQNVAPIPLLWVIPLSIYLVTFILAFESDRAYRRSVILPALPVALGLMGYLAYANGGNTPLEWQVPALTLGLFTCCLACHGELARRKPMPRHLTLYYLMVALGGAVGGIFVALVAPRAFHSYIELPVALVACASLMGAVVWHVRPTAVRTAVVRLALVSGIVAFAVWLAGQESLRDADARLLARNFYGALRVADDRGVRDLFHGTIRHGSQVLDSRFRDRPTTYYGASSGVGRALRALGAGGPVRVGLIGLGAGVLMTYSRAGDVYRVYEINPLVVSIAQREFTFYPRARADKQILTGDARLILERQPSQQFDLLAVDAFSGDAVPVHLLTREALALYLRHLKPDGILAFHVTNRYLDLVPVLARGARDLGRQATAVYDDGHEAGYLSYSIWVLITSGSKWLHTPSFETADMVEASAPPWIRPWTDDYSNILQVMRWGTPVVARPRAWNVVAGRGIGPIRLGASMQDVVARLGPETSSDQLPDGAVLHRWFGPPRNAGLGVITAGSGNVQAIWAIGDRRYVTRGGLRIGSAASQIQRMLGEPSRTAVSPQSAIHTLWYDSRGIWFGIDVGGTHGSPNTIYTIGVAAPK